MQPDSFNDLFTYYFERRLGKEGSAGELSRAVNRLFDLSESEGLKRQSINNWRKGSQPREWWQLGAITCILCETQQEADTLLQVADHDTIHTKRLALAEQLLSDEITRKRVETQVVEFWESKSAESEEETDVNSPSNQPLAAETIESPQTFPQPSAQPNRSMMAVAAVLLIALLGVLGYFWQSRQASPTSPASVSATFAFKDDFSDVSLCESQWDQADAAYAVCDAEAGVLRFDMPAGSEAGWMDDVVDSTLTGDFLFSRIAFTAAINSVSDPATLGRIGIQTDCNGDGTWMVVQIGGPDQSLYAEYGQNDVDQPDGQIYFDEVSVGKEHEIELEWLPYSVRLSLDGETYEQTAPCSSTRWLQLIASGESETHIQGHISEIEAWAK